MKGDDPENRHLKRIGSAGGLRSLRSLFLGGERSEVSLVTMYQQFLQQYGAPGAIINDNWWSSETGSPISAISLSPEAATNRKRSVRDHLQLINVKPGTAGKLMPGFEVRVVDDQGQELRRGEVGNIVLSTPLPPAGFRTLWGDAERFYKGYLKRFGKWMDTGDTGAIHEDGYVSVLSRSDDVINTAGHRLSTSMYATCSYCLSPTHNWSQASLNKQLRVTHLLQRQASWEYQMPLRVNSHLPLSPCQSQIILPLPFQIKGSSMAFKGESANK